MPGKGLGKRGGVPSSPCGLRRDKLRRGGEGAFLVYYYLSSQLLPLARMGLPLVGAKGEEQLLDKLKSYVTVTGVLFRLITKKHTEDTASNPFLIFKIVF